MPSVLALVRGIDRAALARLSPNPLDGAQLTVRLLLDPVALQQELRNGRTDLVLYETGLGLGERRDVLQLIERSGARLLVRTSLARFAAAEVVRLALIHPAFAVSIQQTDNLWEICSESLDRDCGPTAFALGHVADALSQEMQPFVIAALALGRRRLSGAVHAAAFGMAPRTLIAHHRKYRLPAPHRLRTWGQALWAMWRLEVGGFSCKRAAAAGGFRNAAAMRETLWPVLGSSPRRVAVDLGVTGVLRKLRSELEHESAGFRLSPGGPTARRSRRTRAPD